ncbi:19740_t:CDS:2 [Gigaspora margarita]|uniref:19740_t:CDS:1 n=1 Tax=Gigaspora margarita TaxID=4874 RepID=A0ABM8W1E5_GIGMA|nr:19740_t:CDS:2 [Gigaspora margarita]
MEKEIFSTPSLAHSADETNKSISSIFDTLQDESDFLKTEQIASNPLTYTLLDSQSPPTSNNSTNKQKEVWFSDINSLNDIFASLGTSNALTKNPKIDVSNVTNKDNIECSKLVDNNNNLKKIISIDNVESSGCYDDSSKISHKSFDLSSQISKSQQEFLDNVSIPMSSTSFEYLASIETSKSASPSPLFCRPQELSKIDIIQCQFEYFGGKPSAVINSKFVGDLAFLYRVGDSMQSEGGGEISFCLNGMSDEVSIPFNQLTGFKITTDGKINLRFKPNVQRTYRHHLGGYPYLLDPTTSTSDPTSGKFNALHSLLLAPDRSGKLSMLTDVEIGIEKLWFRKHGVHNELVKDSHKKMYLTCVFPTERRALAYPIDSPYHRLLFDLETRFNLNASNINLRFKNNHGDMIGLKDENSWKLAKSEANGKNLIRLDIYIW